MERAEEDEGYDILHGIMEKTVQPLGYTFLSCSLLVDHHTSHRVVSSLFIKKDASLQTSSYSHPSPNMHRDFHMGFPRALIGIGSPLETHSR